LRVRAECEERGCERDVTSGAARRRVRAAACARWPFSAVCRRAQLAVCSWHCLSSGERRRLVSPDPRASSNFRARARRSASAVCEHTTGGADRDLAQKKGPHKNRVFSSVLYRVFSLSNSTAFFSAVLYRVFSLSNSRAKRAGWIPMGEQVTADVLHPLLTRLRQQPVNTISESDRIIISRDATSCYRKLVVHKLAPPQEQCGALENIAVALLHLSGRARSHAVKDAYSLWYKMKKRSRHTSRLDKWVRRMQELEKKLAQPFSSDYYVSSEDPVPERLALVNLLYQDLDSKQLPRELARLRVLGEKVHSVADLPAVLAMP
jgi:hypothetical protein